MTVVLFVVAPLSTKKKSPPETTWDVVVPDVTLVFVMHFPTAGRERWARAVSDVATSGLARVRGRTDVRVNAYSRKQRGGFVPIIELLFIIVIKIP